MEIVFLLRMQLSVFFCFGLKKKPIDIKNGTIYNAINSKLCKEEILAVKIMMCTRISWECRVSAADKVHQGSGSSQFADVYEL